MVSCLACHFGFLSVASHETGAWAVLLVLLFQHDSYPWVGQLSRSLLDLEATNCSKVMKFKVADSISKRQYCDERM